MSNRTKKADTSHYFIDGFGGRADLVGILAYPNALKGSDVETVTFYMADETEWVHQSYELEGRGVVYLQRGDYKAWWVLGKRGEVVELTAKGARREQIPDAGTGGKKLGYVEKLALVDGELYAAGYRRQVYRRERDQWVHIDQGMLASKGEQLGFESLDGTSRKDLYAVGDGGEIWHFDGKRWAQVDSPTNEDLHEVHCVNAELVYAVGANGVVVRGRGPRWEVLGSELEEDLWGVAAFQGKVYVAGYDGIARVEGDEVVPVDTGFGEVQGYRLRATEGALWSIGNERILRFDGKAWTELVCPDNA